MDNWNAILDIVQDIEKKTSFEWEKMDREDRAKMKLVLRKVREEVDGMLDGIECWEKVNGRLWVDDMKLGKVKREEEEEDEFEKALNECDFEVQERLKYICEQLDETSDLLVDSMVLKEQWQVEKEIYRRMEDRENEKQAKMMIEEIEKVMKMLDERYDILEDMWEEIFIGLKKNSN